VARTIEPKELGLAGVLQIARVDRRIGANGKLTRTWLATSQGPKQLRPAQWLNREQGRWGIETRNHYPLDVTHREDESRVRHRNAASVLGLLRRLSNTFQKLWSQGRPTRQATARDWIEENQFNRWLGIRLFTRPATPKIRTSISQSSP
jgi:predicted transposase YbfD/YdcC